MFEEENLRAAATSQLEWAEVVVYFSTSPLWNTPREWEEIAHTIAVNKIATSSSESRRERLRICSGLQRDYVTVATVFLRAVWVGVGQRKSGRLVGVLLSIAVTVRPDASPQSADTNFPSPPGNGQTSMRLSPLIN